MHWPVMKLAALDASITAIPPEFRRIAEAIEHSLAERFDRFLLASIHGVG